MFHLRIGPARGGVSAVGWVVAGALVAILGGCSKPAAEYASPDEAVSALIGALRPTVDKDKLKQILGSEGDEITNSGDEVADKNNADEFLKSYDKKHKLQANADGDIELIVGENDWPMPIPIVKNDDGKWSFDAAEGKDEVLRRRVGKNELETIQVMKAIVDAQRDYAHLDPDNDGLHEYAKHLLSTPGKKDGLFWETKAGEPQSPLGPLVADAAEEGYRASETNRSARRPFHGYYFKLLTAQGPHAKGGEQDYMLGGKLIGGFAVVAWPATYRNSGVMTFITNHDGVVYEKDMGADAGPSVTRFDPGDGWKQSEIGAK